MGLIPEEKIHEIRTRIDIVSMIGEFIPLRRAGTSFIGLCPFHTEKTPSFHVNPVKQFFYCFGCQKSGDIFRFLMDYQSRGFVEVADELARRAGVEVNETSPLPGIRKSSSSSKEKRTEREFLLRVHEISCSFFEEQLNRNQIALSYLQKRGVGDQIRSQFRLGYSPPSWDALLQFARAKGVSMELLEKAGLVIKRAPGHFYDRFRDRIMFPLIGLAGEVFGFGGRSLPSVPSEVSATLGAAKYINSPESLLYKKGEHLYGLSVAKEFIQKSKQAILVEGNFDVLSLHERGIQNTVAPMGTALTKIQIQLLKRMLGEEGNVVLMLDGDRAGQAATMKDIFLFSEQNLQEMALLTELQMDVRVVVLPPGEDPDTYIHHDYNGFMQRLRNAQPALDYVLEQSLQKSVSQGISGKAKIISQVLPLLQVIHNPAALEMAVVKLSSNLAVDSQMIFRQLRNPDSFKPKKVLSSKPDAKPTHLVPKSATLPPIVRNLLSLCGDHPYIISLLEENLLNRLDHPVIAEVLREAHYRTSQGLPITATELIELSPQEVRNAVASAVFAGIFTKVAEPKRAFDDIAETLLRNDLKREMKELRERLAIASKEGNESRISELVLRMRELIHEHADIIDGFKEKL